MQVLVQIDAWDPALPGELSLLAASHDDPDVCHASGSTWWPAIAKLPVLRYDLFDGTFEGQITAPSSSLVLQTEPWPNFARYSFADARLRLWTGDTTDPANVWTLRFDGRVTAQPQIDGGAATIEFAADDRWLDKALLATYAGTTGAEGPAAMKGQAKPLALGAPRYVPGKLIDSVNTVFQVSAYGAIQEFEAALERLVRFGAPLADYATYAALVAATIPAGAWATAKAVGMARFGAPTNGQISFLVKGENAGPDGWARMPGDLIRRIAMLSGGTGKIDDASLNALDVARPYNLSVYVDEQATARDLIQQIAASVNAVAGVSWTGKLFVAPVGLGAPTITLAADGSSLPPVSSVKQIDVAPPWQKLGLSAERAWAVHSLNDIAFTAPLVPMGTYSAIVIYREGNIVDLTDGSRWLYIATTPAAGNAPPTSGTANAWWSRMSPPLVPVSSSGTPLESLIAGAQATADSKVTVFYQASAPSAAASQANDIWINTADGNRSYRRVEGTGRLAIGADAITIGGDYISLPWQLADDQRIAQALIDAAGARATADGKVEAFFMYSAADTEPTGLGEGDLLFRLYTTPVQIDRWTGSAWLPSATYGATSGEAAAIAASTNAIAAMVSDDILSRTEKPQFLREWQAAQARYTAIDAKAATFGNVASQRTALTTAYTALAAAIAGITPSYSDVTQDSPISGGALRTNWADFYSAYAALDMAITGQTLLVQWSVTGAGSWHSDFTTGDKWQRQSVDGGASWSTAVKVVGEDGAAGISSAQVRIYQRASSSPTLPSASATYTFATGALTGLNNGWSASIPAGSNPLYVSAATASGASATDTIAAGEWAAPVVEAQDGAPGADGINSASVFLFQRATSAPAVPGTTLTYTFATGALSGTLGAWSQSAPGGTGDLYRIQATALGAGAAATDTIATGEWSTPAILATNGQRTSFVFKRSATQPATPTDATTPPASWSDAPPVQTTPATALWQSEADFRDATRLTSWSTPIKLIAANLADLDPDAAAALAAAQTLAAGKSRLFYQGSAPTAAESVANDLWINTSDGNRSYRRVDGTARLAIGADAITIGGDYISLPWMLADDQRIAQALVDAAGAQATADSKVITFSQEDQPIAEGIGDLWYQPSTKTLRRWDAVNWTDVATHGATAAEAAAIAASTAVIAMIVNDDVLARGEKPGFEREWQGAQARYSALDGRAASFGGVATLRSTLTTKYNALSVAIAAITPAYSDKTQDSPLGTGGGASLNTKWADFYAAYAALDVAITGQPLLVQWSADGTTGWHDTFTGGDLYQRQSVDGGASWSTAVRLVGLDGAAGYSRAIVYLYQRAASAPSLPSNTLTYTFATNALSGTINNGWSQAVPAGSSPLYVTVATAYANTATDTIASGEWSTPTIMAQDGATGAAGTAGATGATGAAGAPGLNVASVQIFQRAASAPSLPSTTTTFTFATGGLTGLDNGWTRAIPSGTDPLYTTTATAASTGATDTIAAGEWQAATVLAVNGLAGEYRDIKFKRSLAQPTTPTDAAAAGWSDGVPAGIETLWQIVAAKNADGTLIGAWSTPSQQSGFTPRGAYSTSATYYLNNVVTFGGGSYIAVQNIFSGQAPTGTAQANAYWDVYAAPGDPGTPATPPSAFSATINLTSGSAINLRTIANANGYTGLSNATITFKVPNGVTVRGLTGGGIGIDTGTWPSGYTIALTLVVESGGTVDGGGGNGGDGGGSAGSNGGDAIYCRVPLSGGVTINSGGTVRGGGGGGGGGATTASGKFGGGGGGGGAPNGGGGLGAYGSISEGASGSSGTTSGGGAGSSPGGSAGGTFATAGTNSSNGGGPGGVAGYAVRKNGNTATVTNNGTMAGTAA